MTKCLTVRGMEPSSFLTQSSEKESLNVCQYGEVAFVEPGGAVYPI